MQASLTLERRNTIREPMLFSIPCCLISTDGQMKSGVLTDSTPDGYGITMNEGIDLGSTFKMLSLQGALELRVAWRSAQGTSFHYGLITVGAAQQSEARCA